MNFARLWMLLISCWLLYGTGAAYWLRERLARHGRLTQAQVVGLTEAVSETESGYYLDLRFTTAAGAVVATRTEHAYDTLTYHTGQLIPLRYDPRDPDVCLIETERTSWYYLLNLCFTIPFVAVFWPLIRGDP